MTTAPWRASSSRPRSDSSVSRSIRYRSTWASCRWPGYTRTSWKVGLATGAADPAPRATPRTKVVLPAPSSPMSKTMSPGCRRLPRPSPAVSVSAGEFVTVSGKVVVAGELELQRHAVRPQHLHRGIVREEAERSQAGGPDRVLRSDAHQVSLLAAGQGFLQGRLVHHRHIACSNDAPGA